MSKTTVQPLGENVLIAPLKKDKQTNSGIYLPETAAEEKPQEGRVLAIGGDKAIKVKKGQQVIYRRYAGTEIKIDGEECLLIKNEDILAVVN